MSKRINDEQLRKRAREGYESDGDKQVQKSRFRRQQKPISAEEAERRRVLEEDKRPSNGRFVVEGAEPDKWDKQARPKPILKECAAQAVAEGIALFNERRRIQREHPVHGVQQTKAVPPACPSKEVFGEGDEDAANEAALQAMIGGFEKLVVDVDRCRDIRTREQLCDDILRDKRRSGGDRRLEAIRKTLGSLGYSRSQYQKESVLHGSSVCLWWVRCLILCVLAPCRSSTTRSFGHACRCKFWSTRVSVCDIVCSSVRVRVVQHLWPVESLRRASM